MELYQRYHLLLYQAAYGILKNRDDAQDAMQEGMISAFEKLDQVQRRWKFWCLASKDCRSEKYLSICDAYYRFSLLYFFKFF